MWVLDYLEDLESDFSVFHRVEDIHLMAGPRFFRMALRLFAYDGVLAARARSEEESGIGSTHPERAERQPVAAMQMSNPDLFDRVEV